MKKRTSQFWCVMAFGLLVVLGLGTAALAAEPTGTWKWSVERNGQTFETTLKLEQPEGSVLQGSISGRQGTMTPIEDGKFEKDTVSFKVTREFNGNKVVMAYEGKLSGDTIKGTTKFTRDGETQSRDWEAKKAQ